ncbi:MAG: amidase, partial [Proteobacteria bacterium]
MADPRFDSAAALRAALDSGQASSRELVDAALARAGAAAPLGAITHLRAERARA